MKREKIDRTFVWDAYERCERFIETKGIRRKNEKCIDFVEGKQWASNAPDGFPQPQLNILKPTVDYKVALVMRNGLSLHFANNEFENKEVGLFTEFMIPKLDNFVQKAWEQNSMDSRLWDVCKTACITGGSGMYFFWDSVDGKIDVELKDNIDILVADEQQTDLQKQKFIIIPFRELVADLRTEAKKNKSKDVDLIVPDKSDLENQLGEAKTEVEYEKDEDGKTLCLLYMWKDENGFVHFKKSTKYADVVPDTVLNGQTLYPVAYLPWNKVKGSFRGKGDVEEWIPNQVEINCTLARMAVSIQQNAFPKPIYDERVLNPEDLGVIGASISVEGINDDVKNAVSYLQQASMPADVRNYIADLIAETQKFAGRDTSAEINPENASGKAILAVQDASALPLSQQNAAVKKFVEDVGRIWWDIWKSVSVDGLAFTYESEMDVPVLDANGQIKKDDNGQDVSETKTVMSLGRIAKPQLDLMKLTMRVDVSPQTTFSKYAVESSLDNLLTSGIITFDEYVEALPNDSIMPKDKLTKIIENRQTMQRLQAERDQAVSDYEQLAQAIQTYEQVGRNILNGQMNNNGQNA